MPLTVVQSTPATLPDAMNRTAPMTPLSGVKYR